MKMVLMIFTVYIILLCSLLGADSQENIIQDGAASGRRMERLINVSTVQFDEYNVPIINYTVFEDTIDELICLGEIKGKYIDIIIECFSELETLEEIKNISKTFLAKGKAKPEQVDFNRCIGSIIIRVDDPLLTKNMFKDCLVKYGMEDYITQFVNKRFTHREKREFKDFLDCLVDTDEDNMNEEATDCIQVHPIFFEVAKIFKNPFPKRVYPHIKSRYLKIGEAQNAGYTYISSKNIEDSEYSGDDSIYY